MRRVLFHSAIVNAGLIVAGLLACHAAVAADWPGSRGPNHDGKSPDTGLLKEWPEDGPEAAVEGGHHRRRVRQHGGGRRRVYTSGTVTAGC